MKKTLLLASCGLLFGLFSCKKDFTCTCTATDDFYDVTYTGTNMKKGDAKNWCDSWQASGDNAIQYYLGYSPPWYSQYSQSTSLTIYTVLLLFTKSKFPNWLRLFAVANIIVLLPCIFFYFQKDWAKYEVLVYIICFLPMIKAMVFIDDRYRIKPDVIDDGD